MRFTGVNNSRILFNFKKMFSSFINTKTIGRTLLVPGFNYDTTSIKDIARFVRSAGSCMHRLNVYSNTCQDKYIQLGLPVRTSGVNLSSEAIKNAIAIFAEEGIIADAD